MESNSPRDPLLCTSIRKRGVKCSLPQHSFLTVVTLLYNHKYMRVSALEMGLALHGSFLDEASSFTEHTKDDYEKARVCMNVAIALSS